MSEYLIIATRDNDIRTFRCNRKDVANLIEGFLSNLQWDVCWFHDPPLIGQVE